MRKLVVCRKFSQVFFLALFVYILWSTTYPLKGLLPPGTFFKTNPLIMIFTSISERLVLPGLALALALPVLTLILGRFYCGWICPLGAVIDWTGSLRKRGNMLLEKRSRGMRKIKFLVLGAVAFLSLLGIQAAWALDPMVIMARFVSLNLIPTVTLLIDKIFITIFQSLKIYNGPMYDFYTALKSSVLGVKIAYFSHSGGIFVFFLVVIGTAFLVLRFWCRAVCPLGAFYSLLARSAVMRRMVDIREGEGFAVSACRMGAIKSDGGYVKGECVLCMDCVYYPPKGSTKFSLPAFGSQKNTGGSPAKGMSRKDFLFLLLSSLAVLGFGKRASGSAGTGKGGGTVIRPPAALKEPEFINRCIRCGNCMKVCPTNGLQPSLLESGLEGIWTPQLVSEIGYCEYNCTLCGNVCPTGAIKKVSQEEKHRVKLGIAEINRSICLAWASNLECIVCEEHCPVADKAVKLVEDKWNGKIIYKPYVDKELCVGCGICQNKCPARPQRAIKVSPEGETRA